MIITKIIIVPSKNNRYSTNNRNKHKTERS